MHACLCLQHSRYTHLTLPALHSIQEEGACALPPLQTLTQQRSISQFEAPLQRLSLHAAALRLTQHPPPGHTTHALAASLLDSAPEHRPLLPGVVGTFHTQLTACAARATAAQPDLNTPHISHLPQHQQDQQHCAAANGTCISRDVQQLTPSRVAALSAVLKNAAPASGHPQLQREQDTATAAANTAPASDDPHQADDVPLALRLPEAQLRKRQREERQQARQQARKQQQQQEAQAAQQQGERSVHDDDGDEQCQHPQSDQQQQGRNVCQEEDNGRKRQKQEQDEQEKVREKERRSAERKEQRRKRQEEAARQRELEEARRRVEQKQQNKEAKALNAEVQRQMLAQVR